MGKRSRQTGRFWHKSNRAICKVLFLLESSSIPFVRAGIFSLWLLGASGIGQLPTLLGGLPAKAQITADTTTNTRVDIGNLTLPPGSPAVGAYIIIGGTAKGTNLFHSFSSFSPHNIPTEFNLSGPNITNIFSRVTTTDAANLSTLDGYLQAIGGNSPNLFLINPNGISVGPNANLNISGFLFLSTADRVLFNESGSDFFSASDTAHSLLTVSVPVGLQFGADANPISWDGTGRSSRYAFNDGTTVSLLSGGVNVQNAYFRIVSGRIQLGSLDAGAEVALNADTHELAYGERLPLQDISLSNVALDVDGRGDVDVDGNGEVDGGGNLQIKGRDVNADEAYLFCNTSGSENGGLIDLRAHSLTLNNSQIISAVFDRSGNLTATGRGSNINIAAKTFVSQGTTVV